MSEEADEVSPKKINRRKKLVKTQKILMTSLEYKTIQYTVLLLNKLLPTAGILVGGDPFSDVVKGCPVCNVKYKKNSLCSSIVNLGNALKSLLTGSIPKKIINHKK